MIPYDQVIVLDNGTEISIDASLSDLERAIDYLGDFTDLGDIVSDLTTAARLIEYLAARTPEVL